VSRVFGAKPLNPFVAAERILLESCENLRGILLELSSPQLAELPQLNASEFLSFVLSRLGAGRIAESASEGEVVELLGWLELQLDDAPSLVITGFNEGLVPQSVNSDAFLPDTLRRKLCLLDNERRFARDAFALQAILHSRRNVHIVLARTGRDGEPLFPSRLLLACEDRILAERIRRFFSSGEDDSLPRWLPAETGRESGFPVPPPPERLASPPQSVSATAFKTYLACPYRYYLKHVLGLKNLDDTAQEMDGRAFGSLLHEILGDFAGGPAAGSCDAAEIWKALQKLAQQKLHARFGKNALPAVLVQAEQLMARLEAFAAFQADWAREGWEIKFSELGFQPGEVKLEVEGGSINLLCRIDRVDYHASSGTWAVFDYKTGDQAQTPEKAHRRRKSWIDLQLPAYLYSLRTRGITGARTGFINLSADSRKISCDWAEWSAEELAGAWELMHEVAQKIFRQEFWPPEADFRGPDEYSDILGVSQFVYPSTEEEE